MAAPFYQNDWPNPVAQQSWASRLDAYSNPLTERSFKFVFRLPLVTKIERYVAQQPDPVPNLILSTLKPKPVPFFFNLNDDQPIPVWPKYVQQPDYMVNTLLYARVNTSTTVLRIPLVTRMVPPPSPVPDQVLNSLILKTAQPLPVALQRDFANPVFPKVALQVTHFRPAPNPGTPVTVPPFVQSDYPNPVLAGDPMKGMDFTAITYLPTVPSTSVVVSGLTATATLGNPNSATISGIWAQINPGQVPNWTPIKVS